MAVLTNSNYDINRDWMYASQQEAYAHEQRMQYERMRQQDEFVRQQQRMMQAQDPRLLYGNAIPSGHHAEQQRQATVVDPKDPLAFLKKADNKLLLTGEMK